MQKGGCIAFYKAISRVLLSSWFHLSNNRFLNYIGFILFALIAHSAVQKCTQYVSDRRKTGSLTHHLCL